MYSCDEHGYTLYDECKVCGKKTKLVKVLKFSLKDPHGNERRKEKFKLES